MGKRRKFVQQEIELTLDSAGAEGNCIGRWNERVVFVSKGVPGDQIRARVVKQKSRYLEAQIIDILSPSESRITPDCRHAAYCGGCKWRQMDYPAQLRWKQQQVQDAMSRIGHLSEVSYHSIVASPELNQYRNKLEYTFSPGGWEPNYDQDTPRRPVLGYHVPARFDQIFHVEECLLQPDFGNQIRNAVYSICCSKGLTFYNPKTKQGVMRNLLLRCNTAGDWMVVVVFGEESDAIREVMLEIDSLYPDLKSLQYMVNTKVNDFLGDLTAIRFKGQPHLEETLCGFTFQIAPQSFFQVNVKQAEALYREAVELAELSGNEVVYDLYSGTGTISLVLAQKARRVVGVEYVPEAIEDAKKNAKRNGMENVEFVCGDLGKMFNEDFVKQHGPPDVVVTDPPRAGMHADVVAQIKILAPRRIVYISCNPATQARDLALLNDAYEVSHSKAFDMFPHTHHVENVVLLTKR